MKHFLLFALMFLIYLNSPALLRFETYFSKDTISHKKQTIPSELIIYPNPCKTGLVTIETEYNNIAEIYLISIAGKKVIQRKTENGDSKYQLKIDKIPNGIYFMRIKTSGNKVIVKKLVVSSP